jgi:hypothetical protein
MNPPNYKRNEFGLLEGVEYKFNEDGSVNWRAMIKPEHLYPNKEWFEVRKLPVPESIDGLADNQLLVKLGGIKELARLRGFHSVQYTINTVNQNYATAVCEICWMPNYETCGVAQLFASTANASVENCSGFGIKFLEPIAENRAFVRAVRNYLNIHIVGDDEIDKSKNKVAYEESEAIVQTLTPHGALQNAARQAGYCDFEDFLKLLRQFWKDETYKNEAVKDWKSFEDIPVKECRKLLSLVNSCQSKK